jgi:tape measure domain-containing protein
MGGFSNVLGSLSVVIGAEIDDYLNDLARVSKEAGTAVGEVEKKFEGLQTVGTQIAGLGAGLTAGITLPLAGLSALAISAAADMDSLMRGLTAVAGSSEEAGRQMARLKEVAKLPGLALEEAVQGSIRLQSVGVSAEQAERTMKAFGNALATVGKGAPDLEAVISQLVQMSSKTNVVAEDLKPIMERVPQVAAIMKQEFGTINTEVLQKLGVSTKEFTDKVIAGLERLPAVSGGVKNAMENLRDSSRAALTSIGQSLIPVLEKLTPVIEGLLGQVVKLAEWFRNLPAPVQAAVGAVVAFAAALGPVLVAIGGLTAAVGAAMPALTGLAVFFGTSVGALGTWTATIGLAVAALAILTSQASDTGNAARELHDALNMTSEAGGTSKGIIDQVTESLRGMFGLSDQASGSLKTVNETVKESSDLAKFFSEKLEELRIKWEQFRWTDYISPLGVFNKLLRDTAEVVSTIRGVFPDMEKAGTKALESLQKSNQKSASDAAANAMAIDAVAKKQREAAEAAAKTDAALKKKAAAENAAAKTAADHARAVADAWDSAHKRYDLAAKDAEKNRKWFEDAYKKIEQLDRDLERSAAQLATNFAKAHLEMQKAATETVNVIVPLTQRIPPEVQAVIKANQDLEKAYKTLGMTSAEELAKQWKATAEAYDLIVAKSGEASDEAGRAWIAMEEARVKATVAAGGIITEEQKKTLKEMKELYPPIEDATREHQEKTRSLWQDWADDISGILGGFAQAVFDRLMHGSQENERLDEETAKLQQSLADRAVEYEDYVAEVNGELDQLHADYVADIDAETEALAAQLADAAGEWDEYVQDVADNIAAIHEKHQSAIEGERERTVEAIADKTEAYEKYAEDVAERIGEIQEKWDEQLADETESLRAALAERQEDYDDFVEDANTKLSRLGGKYSENIEDETQDTERSIRDREKDYARYAEDVAEKIKKLRLKNKGQYSDEEGDLERSLKRKKEDLDQYVADQRADLEEYRREQQERQSQEEADLKTSMDRKTRDHEQYLAENKAKQDGAYAKYQEGLTKEVGAQQKSLAERQTDLATFVTEKTAALDRSVASHQAAEEKEIEQQRTAMATKKTEYDTHVNELIAASERRKGEIAKHYEDETANLTTELGKQTTEYNKWVTGITGPGGELEKLKEAHRTVWDDIKGFGMNAISDIGASLMDLISDRILGKVTKALGETGLGGILDTLGEKIAGLIGSSGDVVAGVAGSAGGTAAKVGSGLMGTIGAIGGVVSAISGVIGNFQMAGMNKTLDLIEKETRESKIHLQHILEDGVNKYLPKLPEIAGYLWNTFTPAFASLMTTAETMNDRLFAISTNTYGGTGTALNNQLLVLMEIRDSLVARPPAVTIVVNGAAGPQATADAVALKLQGVML